MAGAPVLRPPPVETRLARKSHSERSKHLTFVTETNSPQRTSSSPSPRSPRTPLVGGFSPSCGRRSKDVHPGQDGMNIDANTTDDATPRKLPAARRKGLSRRFVSSPGQMDSARPANAPASVTSPWALRKMAIVSAAAAAVNNATARAPSILPRAPAASQYNATSAEATAEAVKTKPGIKFTVRFPRKLVVDKDFVATAVVLVPDSVGEMGAHDLHAFKARFIKDEFYDIGLAEFHLAVALHICFDDESEFNGRLKWVFLTDNDLNHRLILLLSAMSKHRDEEGDRWCELKQFEDSLLFRVCKT